MTTFDILILIVSGVCLAALFVLMFCMRGFILGATGTLLGAIGSTCACYVLNGFDAGLHEWWLTFALFFAVSAVACFLAAQNNLAYDKAMRRMETKA